VTGATSGIGKAYAHELARRGLDVVLISRSMEKLKQVATEIEQQHRRRTKVFQTDFTHGSEIYEPIRAALQGLEIGILVNNVGLALEAPRYFLDAAKVVKSIDNIAHCNMLSTVKMTQIVLPQMVARKKGIVINLSSISGWRPMPLLLLYSATKAFVDYFSHALEIEYRSKGIIIQSVLPFFVESSMTVDVDKFLKIPAKDFVRQALNTVGLTNRTRGCLSHAIQAHRYSQPEILHIPVECETVKAQYYQTSKV
ncbi:PREDICTED: very-long-chain 3-oxoacyl-CoA reductase-like, partial [Gekko japonicus]|uniref:Very-long-chain 3-oxoacyl-CoA reductase-like n=1 Tax=Gekko japonicus TaxID=146911 RepID=A0ABM1KX53_GEKJA